RGIDAAVARVAVARHRARLAADLERREARLVADRGRRDLVHGDARADVGAVRLAGLGAGEEGAQRAGVVAAAVAVRAGLVRGQARQDREVVFEVLEGLEDRRERELGPFRLRR